MTNKEKFFPGIKLNDIELAKIIACPCSITKKDKVCSRDGCSACEVEWLNEEAESNEHKIPNKLVMPSSDDSLGYIHHGVVNNLDNLARKINEILQYLADGEKNENEKE